MPFASRAPRVVAGLALCAVGGAVCAFIGMPLPWMLGSMLTMAVVQMAGADVDTLPGGRNAGMVVVGITLGLYFTAPVLHEVATYWPWFLALGFAATKLRAPTAYMLGPLLLTIVLTSNGFMFSSMPAWLVNVAQVLLGAVMGSRFEQGFLRAAPRFAAALVPSVGATLVIAVIVGWLLALGSGTYLGNGLLAAAPGGIAEMSITARVLRLGVAFITAAHVVRYIVVVLLTVPVYHLLIREKTTGEEP